MAYTKTQAGTFQQQKRPTQTQDIHEQITAVLTKAFGAITVKPSDLLMDKTGVDYWVHVNDGKPIGVDVKIRRQDRRLRGYDDLALETWSDIERQKIGWTRDASKSTDWVLWYWLDTRRRCLLPFAPLRAVFTIQWEAWRQKYGAHHQVTEIPRQPKFTSECVFVERKVVWSAVYNQLDSDRALPRGGVR
jgi:hypothetical protein